MTQRVAVVGAGVSGVTCAILLAEAGHQTVIFAEETGTHTTSAAAGAIWFPYDVEPFESAIRWALESFETFENLCRQDHSGVSMIELRTFCRQGTIQIPEWAARLGAIALNQSEISTDFIGTKKGTRDWNQSNSDRDQIFASGFSMRVPLIDTTIYLDYLAGRFVAAGGTINPKARFNRLEEVSFEFGIVINCAGIGAQHLVPDPELEPHRGQVVIVEKLALPCAVVCDDPPLMYSIPRNNDCVFGGTNDLSDNRQPDPTTSAEILAECSRVLNIPPPRVVAERVGLRPFRRSGVRLQADQLGDGRPVIHNYGHGGAGFTLSWGCAQEVLQLIGVKST
jgi:D-amino-acid oxidase